VARRREARAAGSGSLTEYLAVIEQDGDAWGAYVPDLPGCVAVGRTREEVASLIGEAVPLHIALMREHGEQAPAPTAVDSTRVIVTST
jgi:predicted RNase H-like HicB family nuclease